MLWVGVGGAFGGRQLFGHLLVERLEGVGELSEIRTQNSFFP